MSNGTRTAGGVLLAAAGGALHALTLPPFDQAWLGWVCLMPLFGALWLAPGWRVGILFGFAWGLGSFLPGVHWITAVTVPGWVLLAIYMSLYPALWGAFAGSTYVRRERLWRAKLDALPSAEPQSKPPLESPFLSSRSNLLFATKLSIGWVAVEHLRGVLLTGFPWNNLSISQVSQLHVIQFAEFTGAAGVSFLLAFVNFIFALTLIRFVREVRAGRLRAHLDYTCTVMLVAAAFVHGVLALRSSVESESIRVAAVQPNIPQDEKWDPSLAGGIYSKYEELSSLAISWKPDLLIWPEASTPYPYFSDRQTHDFVRRFAAETPGSLLLGTLEFTQTQEGVAEDFNVALLFNGGEGAPQIYRKMHLVPFGEFLPFRNQIPLVSKIVGDRVPSDFAAGKEPVVLNMTKPSIQLGALICFEDTDSHLTARFVQAGARLLITITNNGWFKETPGAEIHFRNSIFRSVENRRPLVRAANTGVTCVIDAHGRVLQSLRTPEGRPFMEGIMMTEVRVPVSPPLTFFSRHPDWFAKLCVLIALLIWTSAWLVDRLTNRRKAAEAL